MQYMVQNTGYQRLDHYKRPKRKLGFFLKIKEDENINHSNTGSISRIEI